MYIVRLEKDVESISIDVSTDKGMAPQGRCWSTPCNSLTALSAPLGGILVGVEQIHRVEKHPFGIAASKALEDFAGVCGLLHDHA